MNTELPTITSRSTSLIERERRAAQLKVSLLSQGVSFPLELFSSIDRPFYANQYVYGRTSKGALRSHRLPQAFTLGTGVISAALRRDNSKYDLQLEGDRLFVFSGDTVMGEVGLPDEPAYFGKNLSDGRRVDDFIAVAGETTPGFFLYPECYYFTQGNPCRFCSLSHARKTAGKEMAHDFPPELVEESIRLVQNTPWKEIPMISLTTGTFPNNDEGARYTSAIVRSIYDTLSPKLPIHVLTMPPDTFEMIHLYRDAGATSIAFNIELFDYSLFQKICPGKEKLYGYHRMLSALEYAVKVFGEYNVFCGFVWGLEPNDSVISGYRWCLDRGISISSNVFHADQGSTLSNHPHPDEDSVLELCQAQDRLYREYPAARTIFSTSMRSTLDWEIHRGDFR